MADSTSHIVRYIGDIREVTNSVRTLERINKSAAQSLGRDFDKATQIVSQNISKINRIPIKTKAGEAFRTITQLDTTVRTASGNLRTFSERFKTVDGAITPVSSSMREGGKAARTFTQNIGTLIKRAALTIPVWFALRNSIAGVFRTIRDGIKNIGEFDRALQLLRRNLSATAQSPEELERNFARVRDEITKFSIQTGIAVEDITKAIQRFATVGFNFEESLRAGVAATKLAILEFGDAETTADAFARSLRVLTEGLDENVDRSEAIERALALTDELWKTNAFRVNEFTNNLNKFAGTARVANLSIEETITLLATLSTGGLGERAGRLLRTTILRALADFDKVNRVLRLRINPEVDTTLDFILKLVQALKGLSSPDAVPTELAGVLGDLFSVRSTEILAALTALEKTLKENIAVTADVEKFNSEFEDLTQQTFLLQERFTNLNKEIGKAFVTGLVGGEDFNDTLQRIISFQDQILERATNIGRALRFAFKVSLDPQGSIAKAIDDALDFQGRIEEADTQLQAGFNQILRGLRRQLNRVQLEELIIDISEGNIKLDPSIRPQTESALRRILEEETIKVSPEVEILTNITTQNIREQQKLAEVILEDSLERLKIQGATNSQLLRAEQNLRRQLDLQEDVFDTLKRELELERSITEEQRLRNRLSSNTVTLFRIAQTEGNEIARSIGEVLAGQRDFNTFVRLGGRELEVFKEQFADIFEQQQALRFFRGQFIPELPELRGGTRIPIEEESLRRRTALFDPRTALREARAERQLLTPTNIQQTNNINITQNITPSAGTTLEEFSQEVLNTFNEAVNNPNSETTRSLKNLILGDENAEF